MFDQTMIRHIAITARTVVEPHWADWRRWTLPAGVVSSAGACHITSVALSLVYPHLIKASWQVASGLFLDRGHCWLRATVDDARLLVDITADQFGAEPIIVTPADDRYHESVIHTADLFILPQDQNRAQTWAAMILQQVAKDHPSYVRLDR